jgi:hypothetical protein
MWRMTATSIPPHRFEANPLYHPSCTVQWRRDTQFTLDYGHYARSLLGIDFIT